jgi:hypothetical protein
MQLIFIEVTIQTTMCDETHSILFFLQVAYTTLHSSEESELFAAALDSVPRRNRTVIWGDLDSRASTFCGNPRDSVCALLWFCCRCKHMADYGGL